ncbi:AAA15 family ATPase/GTPase [Arcticibacter tournemirensis]|uniref:AAA family ATPase n=1 Tax=Arcticibacter tournemirensis TaxID=699437 RepID=A0A5M9HHE6_9SPHI|nr:AAA family ATPase [Arcticibacter tournemirensis]KAA8485883.1 AAA family ATPase [Arcticibacter tournemirensis]TQM46863.1 AAA15 family ATPase/GTPase [Arcticibacter tournemirensis]
MESKRIVRHIDRLLLDPNNYRFIDRPEYKVVPDNELADTRVQMRTLNFLLGKNNDNISDLLSSFKTNGFLDIDQIQVKPVGDNFLVLEGNRRTATLKYLYEEFKKGNDVGKLTESDFKSVNVVNIENEDPVQHLVTMGLHHISGKKRWSAVNEAQLIDDLLHKYNRSENDICESLGIKKYTLRRSMRSLGLIQQYKQSDYGDQFQSDMYSIFEAVVGNSTMKRWIDWDDSRYIAVNSRNIDRFFSWISETEDSDWNDEGRERPMTREPIITQYRQVKEVATFVFDEKALSRMEESRSINEGYIFSDSVGEVKLRNSIDNLKSFAQVAYNFKDLINETDIEELDRVRTKIADLLPASRDMISLNERRAPIYFSEIFEHFTKIHLGVYRRLRDITITNVKRVNIFAGGNNKGKTSVLEAIYLLSQLNDIVSLLELERFRGKFLSSFHSKWIEKNFVSDIDIGGIFNSINTSLHVRKEATDENIERTGYLNTLVSEVEVDGENLSSYIHLFSNKEPQLHYSRTNTLCTAAFTSPYRYNESLLHAAHKTAVDNKYFEDVIAFINEYLDPDIEKIDLVNDDGENRFRVSSKRLDKAADLTTYGEGLQRIFEIALLLGYCRNGILCVDELDSALHKSLLVSFTEFLQRTAAEFNVQVFISTHSKECIDAFVENSYPDDDLTAYSLTEEDGRIVCRFLAGTKLKQLVESINLDIR